jgi:hypothetical protein
MKKAIFLSLALVLTLLLAGSYCKRAVGTSQFSGTSFYYWKTKLEFTKADKALADSLGMKRFYLRYFDVDWSPTLEMPVPVGELGVDWAYSDLPVAKDLQIGDYQTIPTVYILNRVFQNNFNADSLASKISRKITEKSEYLSYRLDAWGFDFADAEKPTNWYQSDSLTLAFKFRTGINEIQIDCDWTPATRDRYFQFLKAMKKANPGMVISCTVRLHQFRDRDKAGIPPVGRGTLMCYNMAQPKDISVNDAIFDPALVMGYLKDGDYPLPLEAALPLFSWGALFHENQFKGLASGLSEADVKNNPLFAPESEGRYRFTQDTVFSEVYMREGDIVRLDGPSPNEIQALAGRLGEIKAVKSISFFDWNPSKIREYHVEEICKTFGR